MPPLSKPPATWNPKLGEKERESTWKEAAGLGKSPTQHNTAREIFTRKANEAAAEAKKGIGLTEEDNTILKRKQVRQSNSKAATGVWLKNPENRAKHNAAMNAKNAIPENRVKQQAKDRARMRARMENPENRKKKNASTSAYHKEKSDALQAERAADFEANGVGMTTEFGLGDDQTNSMSGCMT